MICVLITFICIQSSYGAYYGFPQHQSLQSASLSDSQESQAFAKILTMHHDERTCKPCEFFYKQKCWYYEFYHFCNPVGEKKRRNTERLNQFYDESGFRQRKKVSEIEADEFPSGQSSSSSPSRKNCFSSA